MKRKAKESLSIFSIIVIFSLVIFISTPLVFAYVPTLRFSSSASQILSASCYLQHNGITLFSTEANHNVDTLSVGQNKNFVVQPVAENKVSVKAQYQHYTKNLNNEIVFTVTNGDNAKNIYTIRLDALNLYGVDISLPNEYITVTKTDSGYSTNISVKFDSALGLESNDLITFTFRYDSLFTPLEYIESTGTQYIQLPFGFDNTDDVDCRFSIDTSQSYDKYIISPQTWNSNYNKFAMGVHQIFACAYGNLDTGNTRFSPSTSNDGLPHSWTYSGGSKTFAITDLGLSRDCSSNTWGGTTTNLKLFYGYNAPTKGKIYYYKHYKSGVLVCDLIPCKNSNNVVGMFDTVTGTFFANQGTGDFIASDGGSVVDSYSGTEIIFDSNGGTACENGIYNIGDVLPIPTKTGSYFFGWCLRETNNNGTGQCYGECDFGIGAYTSITLYAQWASFNQFTMLEYIESTGTQYMQLPFGFDNTDDVDCRFSIDTSQSYDKYIVSPQTWNNNNNRFAMGVHCFGLTCAYGAQSTGGTMISNANDGLPHNWTYSGNSKTFAITDLGLSRDCSSITWGGTTTNLKLFYGYNAPTKGKIYYYKHYKSGDLVCNLVPCKAPNNVIGLFDLVTGTFFTNQGTGDFNAGPVVS